VFDGFVQPHICIPHVRMGFIMHLYSRNLFSMVNWICGPKARAFPVVLNLASDTLFSALSIFGRGIIPSILLRFEPVF
jgi:hypothetical protein